MPENLIVVGAGAIGCEMATSYNPSGGRVALIGDVLPRRKPKAARHVKKALVEEGVMGAKWLIFFMQLRWL